MISVINLMNVMIYLNTIKIYIYNRTVMTIKPLTQNHYSSVKEIYELGIATGNATFETEAPGWESWDKNHLKTCRIVAVDEKEKVLGWAALSPVSGAMCVWWCC